MTALISEASKAVASTACLRPEASRVVFETRDLVLRAGPRGGVRSWTSPPARLRRPATLLRSTLRDGTMRPYVARITFVPP